MVNTLATLFSFVLFGLLLILRRRAPVALWLPLIFDKSLLSTMLLVLIVIIANASVLGHCVDRVTGTSEHEMRGVWYWWRVFEVSMLIAVCVRIAYVWFRYRSQMAIEPAAASPRAKPEWLRITRTTLGPYLLVEPRWFLLLLGGVGMGGVLYGVNPALALCIAFSAIGVSLIVRGCRNRLDAIFLSGALVAVAFHVLTAVAGPQTTFRGYPFLWLDAAGIHWMELLSDVAYAMCISAVAQRVISLGFMAILLRDIHSGYGR